MNCTEQVASEIHKLKASKGQVWFSDLLKTLPFTEEQITESMNEMYHNLVHGEGFEE